MSKQATQECLSGETLKLAARVGQGVGGPVLKSGSLELHSVEYHMPSREKALCACWETKGRSPSFSGSWFPFTSREDS